jgi:TonB family protein
MSKTRLISALAASVVFLAAACWMVTGAFPLAAAPQMVSDSPGIAVDLGGAPLLHRSAVAYPSPAMAKGVQGTAVVEVKLDASGMVAAASIVSGPEELGRALLQSVVSWHFDKNVGGTTRQVSATFELPKAGAPPTGVSGGVPGGVTGVVSGGVAGGVGGGIVRSGGGGVDKHGSFATTADQLMQLMSLEIPPNTVLKSIIVSGLSDQAKADLVPRLPYHEGDTLPAGKMSDVMHKFGQAAAEFDEHLRVQLRLSDRTAEIEIAPVGTVPHVSVGGPATQTAPPVTLETGSTNAQQINVGSSVQAANLISQVQPVYPPLAKQAHIQGTVELQATIGTDGRVVDLKVLRGHPLLVQAALDAVKDWVYKPTWLNGQPVQVVTSIQVNFTLDE